VTPPPIFPDAFGRFALTPAAPPATPRLSAGYGLFGGLGNLPDTSSPPTYGLFGVLKNPPSVSPDDQSATPSPLSGRTNLAFSPPPGVPEIGGDTGGYAPENDAPLQFSATDWAEFGAQPSDSPPGFTWPTSNSQLANPFSFPPLQTTGLTSDNSDQSARQSPPSMSGPDQLAPPAQSADVGDNSVSSSSAAPDPNESGSITRVVRDAAGRPLAVIHVQPASDDAPTSASDATPDALRPGAKYAQINKAITGNPFIDRTTDMLVAVLQQSVKAIGLGWGPLFGIRVHNDFAKRVRQLDLPGIGQDGVEQSYHFDQDFAWYGMDGSIRTDVTLRNPRDPSQRPVAVYDVKTGNAVLRPRRVEEILNALKEPDLPVIVLHYISGDAVMAPRQ
jgi:hypothetical protein